MTVHSRESFPLEDVASADLVRRRFLACCTNSSLNEGIHGNCGQIPRVMGWQPDYAVLFNSITKPYNIDKAYSPD